MTANRDHASALIADFDAGAFLDLLADRIAERVFDRLGLASSQCSPWLDTAGAADYLAAKPARIHDLVALGKLTPRRDGRRLLFARTELDAYLEASA